MSAAPFTGRDRESADIEQFFDELPGGISCLVFEGEPGIGKTTLLGRARALAAERHYEVLSATPVELEMPWDYSGLADLMAPVSDEVLASLPPVQRAALGAAVFRDEAPSAPVHARTVATALCHVLAQMASSRPVVLVIDDLPWLDLPSARALSYALRRAGASPVALVGAVRVEWASEKPPVLTDSLDPSRVRRVAVGPLGFHALGHVVREASEVVLGRPGLVKVHELSGGNPMFALEIVKENATQLSGDAGGPLGVPGSLRRLVRRRVTGLSEDHRDLLLLAALSEEPSLRDVLAAAKSPGTAIGPVVREGVLERRGEALFFVHPLVRSVVIEDATEAERRSAHRRLARTVGEGEARARHLGLGAEVPDEEVAAELERAAVVASARGSCDAAAALAALAVSLTPPGQAGDRRRRMLLEAENRFEASDLARACSLLEEAAGELSAGPDRAELLWRLARYSVYRGEPLFWWSERLSLAMAEAGESAGLRAAISLDLQEASAKAGDHLSAAAHGEAALELAVRAGDPALEARVCAGLAFHAFIQGQGVRSDLVERALAEVAQPVRLSVELRPRVTVADLLHFSDDLEGARALYEEEYARSAEEGIGTGLPLMMWGMVETEAWSGNWERAEELAAEGWDLAEESASPSALALMAGVRGLMHLYRGRVDEALADARRSVDIALSVGFLGAVPRGTQVFALAGLSLGEPALTHEQCGPASDFVHELGMAEPGVLRFVPDEIEALIRLGELDKGRAMLETFEGRAIALQRRWAIATSLRCRGLLEVATGDLASAASTLERALEVHKELAMPFETARSLLVAGEIARRARQKRKAQELVESAAAVFAKLGAPLWEQRAREEASRLGVRSGVRQQVAGELTEAEHKVADLVVSGLSNAEVAAALFMSQRTVEAHLTRVYAKLAVRSRTQLSLVHHPGHLEGPGTASP